jgi:hypothetical protein
MEAGIMEPGQIMHIVVTVVAIVSAACAALLCDVLRTDNARLRQANLALLAQRQEQQRRTELDLDPSKPRSRKASKLARSPGPGKPTLDAPVIEAQEVRPIGESPPRRVRIASCDRPVPLADVRRPEEINSLGGPGDRGGTLEEARALARHLLIAVAHNGRSRSTFPIVNDGFPTTSQLQPGPVCSDAVLNCDSPGDNPRRNWSVLLKSPGDRTFSGQLSTFSHADQPDR